jgi:hypothetical protein
LADPERFDGREVLVTGFVAIDRGQAVVALNRESINYDILQNGLYVEMQECKNLPRFKERASGKCCVLSGIISSKDHGPTGGFAATLVLREFVGTVAPKGQRSGE